MKTKIVVLTSFLATSIALALVMLTSNAWAEETGPEARQSRAKRVATIDKRGARNVGMSDKRRAAIGETTTSCYALRFLRRFATGILEIGSRSERIAARVARIVATIDKRRAAIGETTTSCYALRFLRRFATGILEIGSRSERNAARVARNVAAMRRIVGMIDKRRTAIGETTTSCYALRFLRRFAMGILEIGSRSERNAARVARNVATIERDRRDDRQEAHGDRGGDHELLRLALLRRFATGIWRSAVGQRGSPRGSRGTPG